MNAELESSSIEYCFGDICDFTAESCPPTELEVESVWTKTTVGVLLEECLKRQKEFHNTRHRRNKFFSGIRDSMLERGFVFNAKTLEKKFYNLKKHFFTICKSREGGGDSTSTKPITWPYHDQMMQMFAEELDIEDAPTMASLYPDIPPKQTRAISPSIEKYNKKDSEPQFVNSEEESRWEYKTIMAFLDECCKRKHDLWDPKIRRRKIFGEIRRRLKANGYTFFQESLDRKLRNMKKQFQVVTETFQKSKVIRNGKRRKITWPYYEKLKELYGKEMERDIRRINAESQREVTETPMLALKFRPIAPKSEEPLTATADDVSPSSMTVTTPPLAKNIYLNEATATEIHTSTGTSHDESILPEASGSSLHTDVKHVDEKLQFIRQIVAFEERRTIVTEQMLAEMIESNKIREKRLEFNRIKLEYVVRKKRKKNGSV